MVELGLVGVVVVVIILGVEEDFEMVEVFFVVIEVR